ncbi:MAG: amidase [Flavobacteriaceae bacterium]|nr:amidase [Flavobacteriaceae bacterium]
MLRQTIFLLPLLFIACINVDVKVEKDPNDFRFLETTISELSTGYIQGDFSIEAVTQAYLDRIEQIDKKGPTLRAIIQVNPEAITIAKAFDEELANGQSRGPLHGIPIVLKDNIDTHDQMNTTAGSRALKGSKPLQDSPLARQLRAAGAVILAKANLSEWANFRGQNSSSGWSGLNGQTKNPYVLTRNPCGSSSGSGVAVSANLTVLAIGTETNGSIVCPSNANGIVGIKPTVGLISRSGIIPISFTQDTAGPMARTLTDATIALGALTAIDDQDSKTLAEGRVALNDYTQFLKKEGVAGKRIALYTAPLGQNADVDSLVRQSIRTLEAAGAAVIEIDNIAPRATGGNSFQVMLHEYKEGLNAYFAALGENAPIKNLDELIAFNEADSIELKYYNQAYLKMANKKEDLASEAYQTALANLQRMSQKEGIDRVMDEHNLDAIVAPTGSPAWSTDWLNGDNYHLGSSSPAAWAGYPNITVPMGDIHGLPVGLSFFGRAWSEPTLIEIAYGFEQKTNARITPSFRANDEK